jgi:hypothetical protein
MIISENLTSDGFINETDGRRPSNNGRCSVQHNHPDKIFFDMEKTGRPSRWNTLRASGVGGRLGLSEPRTTV